MSQKVLLSLNALASEFRMSRPTLTRRLDMAGVRPAEQRNGHPLYRLRDALPALKSDIHGPADLPPSQRLLAAKAAREEMRVALEAGRLLRVEDVRADYAEAFKLLAQACDTAPEIVERDCGASPAMVASIERTFDAVRIELHKSLVGGEVKPRETSSAA